MRRISRIAVLAVLISYQMVHASPILLVSHHSITGGSVTNESEARAQVVLSLFSVNSADRALFGKGVFWEDGDQGTLDFTVDTAADFDVFSVLASNAIDDEFGIDIVWGNGNAGGIRTRESFIYGFDPSAGEPVDLIGYELDLVRLIVQDVAIAPFSPLLNLDGFQYEFDVKYEFFGSPVPEPASIAYGVMIAFVFAYPQRKLKGANAVSLKR